MPSHQIQLIGTVSFAISRYLNNIMFLYEPLVGTVCQDKSGVTSKANLLLKKHIFSFIFYEKQINMPSHQFLLHQHN